MKTSDGKDKACLICKNFIHMDGDAGFGNKACGNGRVATVDKKGNLTYCSNFSNKVR